MKNIFSLRYILLVLICLGTRCGVFAQENPLPKGKYVFEAKTEFLGSEVDDGKNYELCINFWSGFPVNINVNASYSHVRPEKIYVNICYFLFNNTDYDDDVMKCKETFEYTLL